MQNRTVIRAAVATAAASALGVGCLVAAAGADAIAPRTAVPHTMPAWVDHATRVGPASDDASMTLRVYLAPRGGVENLKAAVAAVSTPGSASYRQFITPAAYQARYGPTDASVRA